MTKLTTLVLSIAFLSLSTVAQAADCAIFIERTACSGHEADSYAKCGGKASCSTMKAADDDAACRKLAESECANSRVTVTKSKVVKYTFAGKQSANVCAADRPDFNKCSAEK
jgi:hypothetical protein